MDPWLASRSLRRGADRESDAGQRPGDSITFWLLDFQKKLPTLTVCVRASDAKARQYLWVLREHHRFNERFINLIESSMRILSLRPKMTHFRSVPMSADPQIPCQN